MPQTKKCDSFDKSCEKNVVYLSCSKERQQHGTGSAGILSAVLHTEKGTTTMRYTEGFTGKAILAMKEAIHAAEELGHTYIGSEHLLLGLMEEGGNAAASALAAQQVDADRLRMGVVDLVGRGIPAQVQETVLRRPWFPFRGCQGTCQRQRTQSCRNGASAPCHYSCAMLQCSHHSEKAGRQSEPALHLVQL